MRLRRRYRTIPHVLMALAACSGGHAQVKAPTASEAKQTESPAPTPAAEGVVAPGDGITSPPDAPGPTTTKVPEAAAPSSDGTATTGTSVPASVTPSAGRALSNSIAKGSLPASVEDTLACIRSYEQGPAGYATDTGNGYYGAYQFDLGTWASVGGTGNPAHASPEEQDARAAALLARRGLAPWPTPSRRC